MSKSISNTMHTLPRNKNWMFEYLKLPINVVLSSILLHKLYSISQHFVLKISAVWQNMIFWCIAAFADHVEFFACKEKQGYLFRAEYYLNVLVKVFYSISINQIFSFRTNLIHHVPFWGISTNFLVTAVDEKEFGYVSQKGKW